MSAIWKTQQWPQDWKRQFSFQSQRKKNAKESSNYGTIALISHASKVMLKLLQARLQQYVNHELPDAQAGFRKGRGTRDQIANIFTFMHWRRKWQPTLQCSCLENPRGSLVGCCLWGRTEQDTTEVTQQQQQLHRYPIKPSSR